MCWPLLLLGVFGSAWSVGAGPGECLLTDRCTWGRRVQSTRRGSSADCGIHGRHQHRLLESVTFGRLELRGGARREAGIHVDTVDLKVSHSMWRKSRHLEPPSDHERQMEELGGGVQVISYDGVVRINVNMHVRDVKRALAVLTDTPISSMDISFRNANNETLGGLGLCGETVVEHNLKDVDYIHITADRPIQSVGWMDGDEPGKKYKISEEDYASRQDTFRNFKADVLAKGAGEDGGRFWCGASKPDQGPSEPTLVVTPTSEGHNI